MVQRVYRVMLDQHFRENRQMALVSGPRQVGKTTVCRELGTVYLNWDSGDDRRVILRGPDAIAERAELDRMRASKPLIEIGATHAFQVVFDLPFVAKDCFEFTAPTVVPARTFLSQLL
jgi:uncharacterized protein